MSMSQHAFSMLAFVLTLSVLVWEASGFNNTCAPLISGNGTMNTDSYAIPRSDPPTSLFFLAGTPPLILPQLALLAIVECMQPICSYNDIEYPISSTFDYVGVRIILKNYTGRGRRTITYHDACTALRGLAEYMVLRDRFWMYIFDIYIEGVDAGGGRLRMTPEPASVSDVETA